MRSSRICRQTQKEALTILGEIEYNQQNAFKEDLNR
jgi:hypothetical protein